MIDQSTVQRIMDAADIVDVVGDFVKLRKSGSNYVGLCPFHKEKTGSFAVSPQKGIFKCFGCGEGGNSVHFIMKHEGMGYTDALKYLARKYHIEIEERVLTPEEQQKRDMRDSLFALNRFAQEYFASVLKTHPEGQSVGMTYFKERGFTDDTIARFGLGFCPSTGKEFVDAALKEGFKKEFLLELGLAGEKDDRVYDMYRGRVMFPWYTRSGNVVAFGGRVLDRATKGVKWKYLNSKESELYNKTNELYGFFQAQSAIVKAGCVYIVEGYTDVISMHQHGVENVVANSGTAFTEAQARLLHRVTKQVILLYDADKAGYNAAKKGIDIVLAEGMNVSVVSLPEGEDPDTFVQHYDNDYVRSYLESKRVDFVTYYVSCFAQDASNGDMSVKSEAVREVLNSVAYINDELMRYECTKRCATLFEMPLELVRGELEKILLERKNAVAEPPKRVYQTTPYQQGGEKKTLQPELTRYQKVEREILYFVFKYGHYLINMPDEDGNDCVVHVYDYVLKAIRDDGLCFKNELHERCLQEIEQQRGDEEFDVGEHFAKHTDVRISSLAAELLIEKYQLSAIFDKPVRTPTKRTSEAAIRREEELKKQSEEEFRIWVVNSVVMVVNNYKMLVVTDRLKEIEDSLSNSSDADVMALMYEHQRLSGVKRELAVALGKTIII